MILGLFCLSDCCYFNFRNSYVIVVFVYFWKYWIVFMCNSGEILFLDVVKKFRKLSMFIGMLLKKGCLNLIN